MKRKRWIIVAVGCIAIAAVLVLRVPRAPHPEPGAIIVSTVKGIEFETGLTMHGILQDVLDEEHHPRIVALSGPSFAAEIAQQKPTVVTIPGTMPATNSRPMEVSVHTP